MALLNWLERSRTLEGRFEQVLLSSALGAGPSETGRIYLERPGRVRWEYEEPERKTAMVVDNRTLVYLPSDQQLLRGELDDDSILPRLLVGGAGFRESFEATVVRDASHDGTTRLALQPRGTAEGVVHATVTVDDESGELLEAEIVDAAGNRMRYRFADWKRNRRLPPGIFALEAPPGTEIVDLD
jgi:outer membrane lipoprotein carrier protein